MSYAVVWGPEAEEDYFKLPPLVQSHLLDELDRLAEDPVRLSTRSHFPYRIDRQLFRPASRREGDCTYHIVVLFKYLPNEQAIYLTDIAFQTVGPA